ncbi:hypothetical protein O3P69_004991 [Scylla paramamosain]|uniref:Uncharacterized protein n=1 Tax=Scylla paramamosain TaxID=85552 RepID=A0AAW0U9K3_SCYPA
MMNPCWEGGTWLTGSSQLSLLRLLRPATPINMGYLQVVFLKALTSHPLPMKKCEPSTAYIHRYRKGLICHLSPTLTNGYSNLLVLGIASGLATKNGAREEGVVAPPGKDDWALPPTSSRSGASLARCLKINNILYWTITSIYVLALEGRVYEDIIKESIMTWRRRRR